jgi:flagellar biosynthesis chaperone FliJ
VAVLETDRLRLEERLREIQGQVSTAKGELRGQLGDSGTRVVVRDVRFQAGATLALLVQAQSAALELAGVLKRLEAARGELFRATTARKAVQLLKDRRYAQWRAEVEKREAQANDEIGTTVYVRGMIERRRGVD